MNGDCSFGRFGNPDEPVHDQIGRYGTIDEEQLSMLKTVRSELARVVGLLVKTDYRSNL